MPHPARAASRPDATRRLADDNPASLLSADDALVAALLAVDPVGLGGVALRAPAGPWRSAWLELLKQLLPAGTPTRRVPLNVNDAALLGGLDLAATLSLGRPVPQQGLLAQANGGLVLLAMAERLPAATAAKLANVLDQQEVRLERDGLTERRAARLGVIALDEGVSDDERTPAALLDRLAFHLQETVNEPGNDPVNAKTFEPGSLPVRPEVSKDLPLPTRPAGNDSHEAIDWSAEDIQRARALMPHIQVSDQTLQALCATAVVLGVDSMRAPLLALRVARAAAALAGLESVEDSHAALASQLVLAPRATRLPPAPTDDQPTQDNTEAQNQPEQEPPPAAQTEPPPEPEANNESQNDAPEDEQEPELPSAEDLQELMVQAARAAIPPGLLAALKAGQAARRNAGGGGRAGALQKNHKRGRPIGALRGEPRAGARLHVLDTLRAAAPWQKLRAASAPTTAGNRRRIQVRREDFHVMRYKQNRPTTTVFAVDASGSSALNRLAEAKGAVELLLADCYVRRDRVAVLAFRATSAELLLPPTRSLARAKRSLAALPGGGGTPLAAGIEAAHQLAQQIGRGGETAVVVLLTDGRANIARDGSPGRAQAGADALAAAGQLRQSGVTALLIDTSPQPQASAQALAQAMGATYVPLPYAGAQGVSQAVQLASARATTR